MCFFFNHFWIFYNISFPNCFVNEYLLRVCTFKGCGSGSFVQIRIRSNIWSGPGFKLWSNMDMVFKILSDTDSVWTLRFKNPTFLIIILLSSINLQRIRIRVDFEDRIRSGNLWMVGSWSGFFLEIESGSGFATLVFVIALFFYSVTQAPLGLLYKLGFIAPFWQFFPRHFADFL